MGRLGFLATGFSKLLNFDLGEKVGHHFDIRLIQIFKNKKEKMSPPLNLTYKICFGEFPPEEAMDLDDISEENIKQPEQVERDVYNKRPMLEENGGITVLQQLDKSEKEYVKSLKFNRSKRKDELEVDKFDNQTSYLNRLTIETVECSLCKKKVHENSLTDHILKEHCTNQMLECELCDFVCGTRDTLRYHSVKVHKDISSPCDLCNKSFKDLDSHVKYFHDRKRDFKCNYCEKEFQANFILQNHVKSVHHGRQIKCPDCNKKVSIDNFTRHQKEKHDKMKKPCPHCEKEFAMSNLSRHIRSVHNGESSKCPECSKSYSLSNLNTHMKNVHKEFKKTCDICNSIVPASSLSNHTRKVHNIGRDINNVPFLSNEAGK